MRFKIWSPEAGIAEDGAVELNAFDALMGIGVFVNDLLVRTPDILDVDDHAVPPPHLVVTTEDQYFGRRSWCAWVEFGSSMIGVVPEDEFGGMWAK